MNLEISNMISLRIAPSVHLKRFLLWHHSSEFCYSETHNSWMSTSRSPVDAEMVLSMASGKTQIENTQTCFTPAIASESLHHSIMIRPPDQPANPKTLKVSILGMPNAGKSTFVNALVGTKIMATSSRIDTTIENTVAVTTIGDTQVLFQDTPGILSMSKAKRHGLTADRVSRPSNSFFEADIGIIIADLSDRRVKNGYLQPEILMTMLKNRHVPTILVLNKVDKYKKKEHLPVLIHLLTAGMIGGTPFEMKQIKLVPMRLPKVQDTLLHNIDELDLLDEEDLERRLEKSESGLLSKLRHYRGWPFFEDVFVTSAKERRGIDLIKNYLLLHAKPGSWQYHSELVTDASPKQVILYSVRASLLEHLPEEIPYRVLPRVNEFKEVDDGRLFVDVEVICGRQSHYNCMLRKSGKIQRECQEQLQDAFFMEVFVHLMPVFIKKFRVA